MNILLIKYDISGDFEEFETYQLLLDSTKLSPMYALDDKPVKMKNLLDLLEGKTVEMVYRGISRYDSMHLFVIDVDKNLRNSKLEELFNLK